MFIVKQSPAMRLSDLSECTKKSAADLFSAFGCCEMAVDVSHQNLFPSCPFTIYDIIYIYTYRLHHTIYINIQ